MNVKAVGKNCRPSMIVQYPEFFLEIRTKGKAIGIPPIPQTINLFTEVMKSVSLKKMCLSL
tara:strand:+ start:154 stop:336 length:183 start_codon:yes stop_codon:yes gene_type:complete